MTPFKCFLLLALLFVSGVARGANDVVFADGTPGWSISGNKCTFFVSGRIVNQSAPGSLSGTLRLSLWVTAAPFPSRGYRVATYTLGQLSGGYQYSNFNPVTSVSLPKVTGSYYFTVSLEQYNGSEYVTSDSGPSSVKSLKDGAFFTPKNWKAPSGAVISPRTKLKVGENLNITLQGGAANGGVVYVPVGSQLKLRIRIETNGRTTVYGGSKPQGARALYTYTKSRDSYGGKQSPVGSLSLDYGYFYNAVARSDLSLFFQSANRGFYKSIDSDVGGSGTSWGVFTIN